MAEAAVRLARAGPPPYLCASAPGRRMDLRDQLQHTLGTAYTLERELGGGGMSRVYVAHDTALGRRVVVKVLAPELAAGVNTDRFRREIQVAARLQHSCIVPLLAAGVSDGLPYYTMPFVDGESLRARLARGAIPVPETVRLLRDVAEALSHAHEHGVVHRDIKPENILLARHHALVADFGVAKALSSATTAVGPTDTAGAMTALGVALGTPAYMAPEQAAGDPATDHRADLYALGVVAYEMLAGVHPFAARTPHAMIAAHIAEEPVPLASRRPDVPPALAALVARLMAKRPEERPPTAEAVLRELDAIAMRSGERAASASGPRRRTLVAGSVVVAIAGAAAVALATRSNVSPAAAPAATPAAAAGFEAPPSVAVLPFESIGADSAGDVLADGVTGDIIAELARIRGLTVISRTSAMSYKNSDKPLRTIAGELGVGTVLEGSVQRAGGRVRVVATLVSAASDAQMWSETFDRDLRDVFAIQSELAERIASELKATLSPEARGRLASRHAPDTTAYQRYVEGRFLVAQRTLPKMQAGVALLEDAVRFDPEFALAHATLADAYLSLRVYERRMVSEWSAKARVAADRAIALDSTLGEAHLALGVILHFYDWEWERAGAALRRAADLSPGNATIHHRLAQHYITLGRNDRAFAAATRAAELDPLSPAVRRNLGDWYFYNRRFAEAIAQYRRALALEPSHTTSLEYLSYALRQTGADRESFDVLERWLRAMGSPPAVVEEVRRVFEREGQAAVYRTLARTPPARATAWDRALWSAAAGDVDEAFLALEVALRQRDALVPWVNISPVFDQVRDDSRYAMVRGMLRLPPPP